MERAIMTDKQIMERFENDFVLVQQWTDKSSDQKAKDNLKKYGHGRMTVPLYIVVDAEGRVLKELDRPQKIQDLTVEKFVKFLDRAKAKGSRAP